MLNINSLIYAHIIIFLLIINIIPLLNKININNDGLTIFQNHYINNKIYSIIIDFIIIYILLKLSDKLSLNIPIIFRRIIIILLYNVLLSIYINKTPFKYGNILYKEEWSLNVGWFAIIWDLLYINSIGYLHDSINIESENINLGIMSTIGFCLLHY